MVAMIGRIPPSTIMAKKLGLNTGVSDSDSSHKNRKYIVARGSPNKYRTSVFVQQFGATEQTLLVRCKEPKFQSSKEPDITTRPPESVSYTHLTLPTKA